MIYEINVVQDDDNWWVNSGVSRHVCKNRHRFKTYQALIGGWATLLHGR